MWRKVIWTAVFLALPLLGSAPSTAAPPPFEALQLLASWRAVGTTIDWQPRIENYDRLILTVTGPNGLVIRREFERGQDPSLSLTDKAGQPWPDGAYSYELRLVPKIDESLRQEIRHARETGDEAKVERLVESSGLRRASRAQSGVLQIRNRGLDMPDFAENPSSAMESPASELEGATTRTLITPPLIVQGGACIGDDCTASENPFNLLLKQDDPSITFLDLHGGFSGDRDWSLIANQTPFVGNSFSIRDHGVDDVSPPTTPFAIEANAPTYSLFIRSNGNLGLGSGLPIKDLHLANPSSPTIRLEQTPGALPARTWDLVANDVGFSVQDVTGAKTPLRVRAAAPTGSVEVGANGNVGVGTTSPSNSLHVRRSDGTAKVLVEESSGTTAFRELLELRNNGDPFLIFANSATAGRWSNGTNAGQFQILDQADVQTEFTLDGNGNLTVSGTVTPMSSREVKQAFDDIDGARVLDRVLALPITTWAYKEDPNVRHMGPMAEDFFSAFNLGPDDKGISVTDSAGVAFAAIQGLYARIIEREATVARENAELAQRNRDLEERLTRLEAALGTGTMSVAATVSAPR